MCVILLCAFADANTFSFFTTKVCSTTILYIIIIIFGYVKFTVETHKIYFVWTTRKNAVIARVVRLFDVE